MEKSDELEIKEGMGNCLLPEAIVSVCLSDAPILTSGNWDWLQHCTLYVLTVQLVVHSDNIQASFHAICETVFLRQ